MPAEADHQAARNALSALPPAARAFLEALHAEYFPPRADGGMAYRLEGLLGGDRYGFGDDRLVRALAVPAAYLGVVRGYRYPLAGGERDGRRDNGRGGGRDDSTPA